MGGAEGEVKTAVSLPASLTEWPVVSQGAPAEVGNWDKTTVW